MRVLSGASNLAVARAVVRLCMLLGVSGREARADCPLKSAFVVEFACSQGQGSLQGTVNASIDTPGVATFGQSLVLGTTKTLDVSIGLATVLVTESDASTVGNSLGTAALFFNPLQSSALYLAASLNVSRAGERHATDAWGGSLRLDAYRRLGPLDVSAMLVIDDEASPGAALALSRSLGPCALALEVFDLDLTAAELGLIPSVYWQPSSALELALGVPLGFDGGPVNAGVALMFSGEGPLFD